MTWECSQGRCSEPENSPVEALQKLRRFGAMEVRDRRSLLRREAVLGLLCVEEQRQDTVEKSGLVVHRGDVAIERKIARAELDGLLGRAEQ